MTEFTENSLRGLADRFADTDEGVEYFQRCREVLQALLEVGLLQPGIEGRFVKLRYYEAGFTKGLKASLRHDGSPSQRTEVAADEDQEPDLKPEEQSRAAEPLGLPLTAPEGFCVPCGSFDACYANECQWELGHKPCRHYRLDQ